MSNPNEVQYEYDQAIIIGRFQPFHLGHLDLVRKALEIAPKVKILIGSSLKPRDIKNPFTAEERRDLILNSLYECVGSSIEDRLEGIFFLEDSAYNEQEWIASVQNIVNPSEDGTQVAIVGHRKDDSSYYLDLFPQYRLVETDVSTPMDATTIREMMWNGGGYVPEISEMVPGYVALWLQDFAHKNAFWKLEREYDHLQNYKRQWANTPYPVTFVTVDAVVVCKGHILLVKRGAAPGEGLWALPGGFLKSNKSLKDSVVEELYEETRIRIPRKVLENSVTDFRCFDDPNRSLRGRTLTHVFLFELKDSYNPPVVRGGDDASNAKWVTISEFYRMTDQLFEDHSDIGRNMLGRV